MNLKQLRNQKKITVNELSELSGVSKRGIEDLEKRAAEANPYFDTALKLANALEVTLEELMLTKSENEKFEDSYNLLSKISAYDVFTNYAYDKGQIPCTIEDAEAILKLDDDISYSVDDFGRVFTEAGVYIADMYCIDIDIDIDNDLY